MNSSLYRQQGLSLVELMIALLVSSMLILGVTQVYLDGKRNHLFNQGQTANLDTGRFSALMLENILGKAGYRRNPEQSMAEAFPASNALDSHCTAFRAGHAVTRLSSADTPGLCIRYQAAVAGEPICDGTTTALAAPQPFLIPRNNELVVLALKFETGQHYTAGVIRCISNRGGNAELIEGIVDMRIWFAVGEDSYRRLKKNAYRDAASWSGNHGMVRAIGFELLAADGRGTRDGESEVFNNWLTSAAPDSAARLKNHDQRHIYQLVVGSQALRNLMP